MIFILGIINIIIQKNKFHVIYFCPNCVNFLPENANFYFLFIFLGGDCPPAPPARVPMTALLFKGKSNIVRDSMLL